MSKIHVNNLCNLFEKDEFFSYVIVFDKYLCWVIILLNFTTFYT